MNNLLTYCGLTDSRMSAFEKDLPVLNNYQSVLGYAIKVQVNLCQKLSFLNQLTHNMTRDCSLNSPEKYKFRTCSVQILF